MFYVWPILALLSYSLTSHLTLGTYLHKRYLLPISSHKQRIKQTDPANFSLASIPNGTVSNVMPEHYSTQTRSTCSLYEPDENPNVHPSFAQTSQIRV